MSDVARRRPKLPTVLIGLYDPLAAQPSDVLLPWPPGSLGARLIGLLQEAAPDFTEDEYLVAFERHTLWRGQTLPQNDDRRLLFGREGRRLLALMTEESRDVVLLGHQVWTSVLNRARLMPWFYCTRVRGSAFTLLPNPSSLNRRLNDAAFRQRAGRVLLGFARSETFMTTGGKKR